MHTSGHQYILFYFLFQILINKKHVKQNRKKVWNLQKALSLRTIKVCRLEIIDEIKYVYCIKHAYKFLLREQVGFAAVLWRLRQCCCFCSGYEVLYVVSSVHPHVIFYLFIYATSYIVFWLLLINVHGLCFQLFILSSTSFDDSVQPFLSSKHCLWSFNAFFLRMVINTSSFWFI